MKVVAGHHYLAFVLDEACKEKLISLYPKNHSVIKCDHVTIAYPVKEEDISDLQYLVNSKVLVEAESFIETDCIDVFRVYVNFYGRRLDGKQYHLTYTRSEDRPSSDANKIFEGGIVVKHQRTVNVYLTGEFKLVSIK
jgi:hypothetical protein